MDFVFPSPVSNFFCVYVGRSVLWVYKLCDQKDGRIELVGSPIVALKWIVKMVWFVQLHWIPLRGKDLKRTKSTGFFYLSLSVAFCPAKHGPSLRTESSAHWKELTVAIRCYLRLVATSSSTTGGYLIVKRWWNCGLGRESGGTRKTERIKIYLNRFRFGCESVPHGKGFPSKVWGTSSTFLANTRWIEREEAGLLRYAQTCEWETWNWICNKLSGVP